MPQLADDSTSDSLAGFVRVGLGCSCPPEVLERIETEPAPSSFNDVGGRWLIKVGGRLLVLLCRPPVIDRLQSRLSEVLTEGAELRDREGFNRLRLVVATPEVERTKTVLEAAFSALVLPDERLHLHVVSPVELPGALR